MHQINPHWGLSPQSSLISDSVNPRWDSNPWNLNSSFESANPRQDNIACGIKDRNASTNRLDRKAHSPYKWSKQFGHCSWCWS